jgi:glycine/D-amino acid oxidase-like deaminating enzyme
MRKKAIILGAGCGGLWLAYDLLKSKIDTLLIDSPPYGSFASTRNQSWLHTGAFYAINGVLNTVSPCKEGYREIHDFCTRFAPGAIDTPSKCLFLFDSAGKREEAAESLRRADLQIKFHERNDLEDQEPVLRPAELAGFGLETEDKPFDSAKILQALATEVFRFGDLFHQENADLRKIKISRRRGLWRVDHGAVRHTAEVLICAAGALNPSILESTFSDRYGLTIQKSVVGVLHQQVCRNMLLIRCAGADFLHLVPFRGGVSINFGLLDTPIKDANDNNVWPDALIDIGRQLTDFLPGLLRSHECQAHFYVCQKLNNTNAPKCSHPLAEYGARHFFWIEPEKDFFSYYPGKFTLAPIGAKALGDLIRGRVSGAPPQHTDPSTFGTPDVATRPYFREATHATEISRDALIFKPVR